MVKIRAVIVLIAIDQIDTATIQWKWSHFQTLFLIAKMASMLASLSWLYPPSGGVVHGSIKVKCVNS
jgi:hypothetical protein